MIRVGVLGALGRMGRLIVAGLEADPDCQVEAAVGRGGLDGRVFRDCDVVIDFSLAEGTGRLLSLLDGQALVCGTTGLTQETQVALRAYAERAPVLWASNFSTGVNLLMGLVAQAAAALPEHHLEIVEMHHALKRDAPSGTARTLAEVAADARHQTLPVVTYHGREGEVGARSADEIGIHALRGGDVVGEHTVYLAGPGERLSLGHLATSRQAFAGGAIRAAKWVAGRPPGTYTMAQVLGL